MTPEQAAKLREPFLPSQVGQLPKIACKQCTDTKPTKCCAKHTKQKCRECGNFITSAHVHLDYVGHAACTDRLLQVDPEWSWEPLAYNDKGLPLVDNGALWIKLTIGGVTRLGVGDAAGKAGPDALKEMIGDALRNAAMRFGVALDLWSKEDLHVDHDDAPQEAPKPAPNPPTARPQAVKAAPAPKPVDDDDKPAYDEADLTSALAQSGIAPSKAFMEARRIAQRLGETPPLQLDKLEPGVVMDALVAWVKGQAAA